MTLNIPKCESLLMTRKHKPAEFRPLNIKKTPIPLKPSLKYLGVVLDKSANLIPHITHTVKKAFLAYQNLYTILSPTSPLTLENKTLIYKQIIRPTIMYAAPIFCGSSDHQLNRVQIMQNKILRCITKSSKRTRLTLMHERTNTETVKEHVFKLAQNFYTTLVFNSPLTENITQTRHDPQTYIITKPLYHRLPLYYQPPLLP